MGTLWGHPHFPEGTLRVHRRTIMRTPWAHHLNDVGTLGTRHPYARRARAQSQYGSEVVGSCPLRCQSTPERCPVPLLQPCLWIAPPETLHVNTSPSSAAYIYLRQWTGSALVQVMACRLFGAKPLPEPMLAYCRLDSWDQISVKFESEFYHFHSRKCIWNCRLSEWRMFCPWGDESTRCTPTGVDSLACNFKNVISEHILSIDSFSASGKIIARWMS